VLEFPKHEAVFPALQNNYGPRNFWIDPQKYSFERYINLKLVNKQFPLFWTFAEHISGLGDANWVCACAALRRINTRGPAARVAHSAPNSSQFRMPLAQYGTQSTKHPNLDLLSSLQSLQ